MRSRQVQMIAQKVRKIDARENMRSHALTVDLERDRHGSRH
jgi:hypothetical protein